MTLKEYQQQSKRTCPNLSDNLAVDLAHMVLGMNSEISELEEAFEKNDLINVSEELADNFGWYMANYCTFRHLDYSTLFNGVEYMFDLNNKELIEHTYNILSKLQDLIKKNLAYKKEIKEYLEIEYLEELAKICFSFCKLNNIDFNKALENNINKLLVRFPIEFTETLANNRDLESERKELEK